MVVPAELAHAQYAQEVMRFLTRRFASLSVCMFQQKLFPGLSEDTFLLLAEGKGRICGRFTISPFDSIADVVKEGDCSIPVNLEDLNAGRVRLTHYLLAPKVRHLYQTLSEQKGVFRFGETADIGIGYVTGANDFFHLSERERLAWKIPHRHLKSAIVSLAGFRGLTLKSSDWRHHRDSGEKAYLLASSGKAESGLPESVRLYVSHGVGSNIPKRFKCRVRKP